MMQRWLRFIVVIGALLLGVLFCVFIIMSVKQKEDAPRCIPPGDSFTEADLTGTWTAERLGQSDTLIIKADGTYKQIIHVEFPQKLPIYYEGGWQPWHLEYSKDNIPYLHLIGMRFCGMNPGISCEQSDGGGYDFCQDKYVPMNGEGILLVLGTPGLKTLPTTAARQHYIDLFYPLGSENSWIYSTQMP